MMSIGKTITRGNFIFGRVTKYSKYEIILLALERKSDGKPGVGGRKISWLNQIRDCQIRKCSEYIRLGEDD